MSWRNLRRRVRLSVVGPRAPRHPGGFQGPVVILGSAPVGTIPIGFDGSYKVLTVNASQVRLDDWGLDKPTATFIHFYNIDGKSDKARGDRKQLEGRSTGDLHVLRWKRSLDELKQGIAAFGYSYDRLHMPSKLHRMALHLSVMKYINNEDSNEVKFSNGITALFYALRSGAPAVILSGINPVSTGHFYDQEGRGRLHGNTDLRILNELRARGLPIYTADAVVADLTGINLWNGRVKT